MFGGSIWALVKTRGKRTFAGDLGPKLLVLYKKKRQKERGGGDTRRVGGGQLVRTFQRGVIAAF